MASNTSWSIDGKAAAFVREARERLDLAEHELILDFSAVRRLDPAALRELEQLAAKAQEKSVKVILCGVGVEVYKVLKLAAIGQQFTFLI